MEFIGTGIIPRALNSALVIRLSKSRINLLSFHKLFYSLREPTDASAEQSVEDELYIDPIRGIAYVKRDSFLVTPTKLADIAYAKETKG